MNDRPRSIPVKQLKKKVSLSDRFGLWIGFHNCSQDEYLTMVQSYVEYYNLQVSSENLRAEALEWSVTRGARSGRVAFQFVQDLAGRLGQKLHSKEMKQIKSLLWKVINRVYRFISEFRNIKCN